MDESNVSVRAELDRLLSLVKSLEWKEYLRLKEEHGNFLQKEVNTNIAKGEYRLADRAQAKLEENKKDVELLQKRMSELQKLLPPEEGF